MVNADFSDNVSINVDKTDLGKHEVVYKPTTTEDGPNSKEKFQPMKEEKSVKSADSFYLYASAFVADLIAFSSGIGFSWTSPVLPKLDLNATEKSIVASTLTIGAAIGPFIFGYLADKKGRKKTLMAVMAPMAVALAILAFTTDVRLYYLARLLYGLGIGGCFSVLTMYIGEITDDSNRGKFGCILGIFVTVGILFPFIVGPPLSIKKFCLSCLFPIIAFFAVFPMLNPETPLYLIKTGDQRAAQDALMKLRRKPRQDIQEEYAEIKANVDNTTGGAGLTTLFKRKGNRMAFIIVASLLVIQQASGIGPITSFLQDIFDASGGRIPPEWGAIIVGLIQTVTVVVTASLVDRLGRKLLLLGSAVGSSASITLLGLYFFLHRHNFDLSYFWWLPIVCLKIYIICFNLGLGPVPWAILSEVFPSDVKSIASSMITSLNFVMSTFFIMGFPLLNEIIGMAESFWIFGVSGALGSVFIYLMLPETKGKTVAEIQQILSR